MEKHFSDWHKVKIELDHRRNLPTFSEREIWWCSIGVNVGYEIFGKNDEFIRPVLILKKYSRSTFFGLPMTSKRKSHIFHYPLDFKGVAGSILLDQGRTLDSRRLGRKLGKLPDGEVDKIRESFCEALK
jgi:mRNA-degrading endonuclease toxin of MazEF toxin-antitoxin module